MPRVSLHERAYAELDDAMYAIEMLSATDSDSEGEEYLELARDALIDEYIFTSTNRYLSERQPVLRTGALIDIIFENKTYRPEAFRDFVRVSVAAFDYILDAIKDNEIFCAAPGKRQIDVEVQLAVLLYRLGHYGNDAGEKAVAQLFGLGLGTIVKYTNRALQAVLQSSKLKSSVRWPQRGMARDASKQECMDRTIHEWRGGWCGVDGTTIPLAEKPKLYGAAWFDRKGRYSMNVQIVNDHKMNIIDFSVGKTGSRCDSVAFADTLLSQKHEQLLDDGEWCWGDARYKRQDWLVTPFTRPHKDPTRNRHFNYHLYRIRVSSEHTIGWLKGRFQCLKELRVHIATEDDVAYACSWIRAAILLHQAAKSIEQGQAEDDLFCVTGTVWEVTDRQEQDAAAGSTQMDTTTTERRSAQLARADAFRSGLMEILCKVKSPQQSRRTF